MQKSSKAQGANNEPIWFTKPTQTGDTEVTTINIGTKSQYKIVLYVLIRSKNFIQLPDNLTALI